MELCYYTSMETNENEQLENDIDTETPKTEEKPSVLEINVFDKVAGKAVGPGQR